MAASVAAGAGVALLLGACGVARAESSAAAAALAIDFSKQEYFPLAKSKIAVGRALSTPALIDSLPYLDQIRPALYDGELRFPEAPENFTALDPYPFEVAKNGTVTVTSNKFLETLFDGLNKRNIEIMIQLEGAPRQWWDYDADDRPHLFPMPTNLTAAASAIGKWTKLYSKWPISWCMWNEPSHTLTEFPDQKSISQMTDIYDAYTSAIAPQGLFGFASFITPSASPRPALGGKTHLQASIDALQARRKTKTLPFNYLTLNNYGEPLDFLVNGARNALGTALNTVPIIQAQFGVFLPHSWEKQFGLTLEAVLSMKALERALRIADLQTFTFAGWIPHMVQLRGQKMLEMPLLHALALFARMPDRRVAVPSGLPEGVGAMASGDEHRSAIMIWNESNDTQTINVKLAGLQNAGAAGELKVYHIDKTHGSPIEGSDNAWAASETVKVDKITASMSKSVTVAGPGIAYVEIGAAAHPVLDRNGLDAKFLSKHTYADRIPGTENAIAVRGSAYGHYDAVRAIAYTGVKGAEGTALVGAEYRGLPDTLKVEISATNLSAKAVSKESLLGIRVDYLQAGKWTKSVLWHGDVFDASRTTALPWGKRGATADAVVAAPELNRAKSSKSALTLQIAANAPADWAGAERRAIVSFWMDSTGPGSQARFVLG